MENILDENDENLDEYDKVLMRRRMKRLAYNPSEDEERLALELIEETNLALDRLQLTEEGGKLMETLKDQLLDERNAHYATQKNKIRLEMELLDEVKAHEETKEVLARERKVQQETIKRLERELAKERKAYEELKKKYKSSRSSRRN